MKILKIFAWYKLIMQAINSKLCQDPQISKSLDFRRVFDQQMSKGMKLEQPHSKSLIKHRELFEQIVGKRMEKIEDLEKAQKQFKYQVKILEDRQHAKRFAKLESIKKIKTEGNQRDPQQNIKKIVILNNEKKEQQLDSESCNNKKSLKKIRHQSNDPKNKIKMNLCSKSIDFYDMNVEVEDLTNRLNSLINSKLLKLSITLKIRKDQQKNQISKPLKRSDFYNDLNDLVQRIKALRLENNNKDRQIQLLNKKIQLIESLMAQNVTESELIKKFYYFFSSKKSRNNIGKFLSMGPRVFKSFYQRKSSSKDEQKHHSIDSSFKPGVFFGQSTNKQSFQPPKRQFYNNKRLSQHIYKFNDQPLPRSSYKRDFLNVNPLPVERMKGKQGDPHHSPNYTTTMKSRYNLDFHQPRVTEKIDFRQLDSYHDKLKFLEVSFFPSREQLLQKSFKKYEKKDESQIINNIKIHQNLQKSPSVTKQQAIFDKMRFVTESQKSYGAFFANERSKIKHQQLKEFEYRLKNLYKS